MPIKIVNRKEVTEVEYLGVATKIQSYYHAGDQPIPLDGKDRVGPLDLVIKSYDKSEPGYNAAVEVGRICFIHTQEKISPTSIFTKTIITRRWFLVIEPQQPQEAASDTQTVPTQPEEN